MKVSIKINPPAELRPAQAANMLRGPAFHLPAAFPAWLFVPTQAIKVVCLQCKTAACETLKSSPWPGVTYCSCQHSEINLMGSRCPV